MLLRAGLAQASAEGVRSRRRRQYHLGISRVRAGLDNRTRMSLGLFESVDADCGSTAPVTPPSDQRCSCVASPALIDHAFPGRLWRRLDAGFHPGDEARETCADLLRSEVAVAEAVDNPSDQELTTAGVVYEVDESVIVEDLGHDGIA